MTRHDSRRRVEVTDPIADAIEVEYDTGELVLRGTHWSGTSGARVLLLHGGGQTRRSWLNAARALAAERWSVTTFDLRGHGESDWAHDGDYTLDANGRDLTTIVTSEEQPVILVGASLGGLTAISAYASIAERVRGLALVDIVPNPAFGGVTRIHSFMKSTAQGFETLESAANAIAEYTGRPRRDDISGLQRVVRRAPNGRWYWRWDPRVLLSHQGPDGEPRLDTDALLRRARAVTAPAVIIHGSESDVVDTSGLSELQAAIPHSVTVQVRGAGHMITEQDNDAYSQAVVEFVDQVGSQFR